MCNMCVMLIEGGQKRCLLTRGDQIKKQKKIVKRKQSPNKNRQESRSEIKITEVI